MVMPSSPALVRELSPADAPSRILLEAALQCARSATKAGIEKVDIVGSRHKRWRTGLEGSFRAWGAASLSVSAGNFLPELLARYVLSFVPGLSVEESRANLGVPREDTLTVVVVDGSAGLTQRAPLALVEGAVHTHHWCQKVCAGRDVEPCDKDALAAAGVQEPQLWEELSRLRPRSAELLAADATLGVGRYVAGWEL